MVVLDLPELPTSLKSIEQYLKIASQHDQRDVVISYWCRFYALQTGLKLCPTKTREETNILSKLLDWLKATKDENRDNEAVTNDIAAQAHIENWALKLFLFADKNDRASNFGKNVIQSFFTAGLLYDVLTLFGELSEEAVQNRKYAKWKAVYIHNCLKSGQTPEPGPMPEEEDTDLSRSLDDEGGETFKEGEAPLNRDESVGEIDPSHSGEQSYDHKEQETVAKTEGGNELSMEQIGKAQKLIKWAGSALNYDDVPTAVLNLRKALHLLTTGQELA